MSWTNLEKRREYDRKWRAEHPDKCREWHRKWREKNPEKEAECRKRYAEAHHDQILEKQRKYRAEHREEINARRRKTKTNIPAGDGTITVDLDKRDSWNRKARSAEDVLFHAEFGMGYDEMEKYRRIKEYE
jgi:hypothetical protein